MTKPDKILSIFQLILANWVFRPPETPHPGLGKKFPGPGQGVLRVNKTQLARINWKIKSILSGLVTRRLYFLKKCDTKWPFSPPCRNWPIYVQSYFQVYFFTAVKIVIHFFDEIYGWVGLSNSNYITNYLLQRFHNFSSLFNF